MFPSYWMSKYHTAVFVSVGIRRMQFWLFSFFREIKLGQHVLERTDLPDELITQVSGITIFAQEFPRVFPLTSFFEPEINQASQNLVNNHAGFSQTGILHRQRHDLRSVPVNEIHCIWKDKPYRFWVYGTDHRVHCPDYPQQCCCGCVIL